MKSAVTSENSATTVMAREVESDASPALDPLDAARLKRIKTSTLKHFPKSKAPDRGLLEKAFRDAEFHHRLQVRKSGEPFIFHPARVALMAAEAGMDTKAVIIALLHDVIEDTEITKEEMGAEYGSWLADTVDGLTKAAPPKPRKGRPPVAMETYRKLISSTIKDLRTLQVKILDRLDNMRDLGYLSRLRQRRISTETMTVYVPMAARLGMQDISDELAALSFRYHYPKRFQNGLKHLKKRIREEAGRVESVRGLLETHLGRVRGLRFEVSPVYRQISDFVYQQKPAADPLSGFKVRVPKAADCYRAMGALHMGFRVVPNSIRDYISNPKPNRYQALCSEVFIGSQPNSIQVVSEEMEKVNAKGILAGASKGHEELYRYYENYLDLLDHFSDTEDLRMEDVLRYAQMDTLQLFTPKGEPLTFPQGATVLDFAFSIHSDIGVQCEGGRMAGRRVSRFEELTDGAMVEVLTSPSVIPRENWLDHVRTSRARLAIRRHLRAKANKRAQEVGRKLFAAELELLELVPEEILQSASFREALKIRKLSVNRFYLQVGNDKLPIRAFLQEHGLVNPEKIQRLKNQEDSLLARYWRPMFRSPFKSPDPVLKIGPREDGFFQMGHCCQPLPGDPIVGVQQSGGIVIHRGECAVLERAPADSLRSIGWETERGASARQLDIRLAQDQPGLLYKVSKVMRDCKVNIVDLGLHRDGRTGEAIIRVDLEPITQKIFRNVVSRLRGIKEVEKILMVSRPPERQA